MSPPDTSAAEIAAVAWLVRVQSDAATADDWAALTLWLEASEANAEAFARAEQLSGEIDDGAALLAAGTETKPAADILAFRPRPRRPARWTLAVGAAAAAVVAVVVALPTLRRLDEGPAATYRTAAGETREIALADGSRVHLDGASTMTVRLGWRTRRVDLGQAQASFDVAKDPRRPFIVGVGDREVRVVGTEFNVLHDDKTLVVTVRRGIVEVRQPGPGAPPAARLTPGATASPCRGNSRFNADAGQSRSCLRLDRRPPHLRQRGARPDRRRTEPTLLRAHPRQPFGWRQALLRRARTGRPGSPGPAPCRLSFAHRASYGA